MLLIDVMETPTDAVLSVPAIISFVGLMGIDAEKKDWSEILISNLLQKDNFINANLFSEH